jgi:serine/threonine protein phosphatase PrpC
MPAPQSTAKGRNAGGDEPADSSRNGAPLAERLSVARLSDVGRARVQQEDCVGVFVPADTALLARKGQLLIVADGMGGHNSGEIASQTAVAEVERAYYAGASDDIPADLRHALLAADAAIFKLAQLEPGRQGMGTTAAVAVVREREVHIANLGDSRVYLLRGGAITQVTQDHSWVAEQVRAGLLTPEQARVHPQRNIITRALGTGAGPEPDLFNGTLELGDALLICSDGLSNPISEAEMLEIVGQLTPDRAVRRLVDLANERGGVDNISVVIARLETQPNEPAAATVPSVDRKRERTPLALLAVAGLLLIAAVAGAVVLARGRLAGEPPTTLPAAAPPSPTTTLAAAVAPSSVSPALASATKMSIPAEVSSPEASAEATASAPTATLALTFTSAPTATATPRPRATPTARPRLNAAATTAAPPGGSVLAPSLTAPQDGLTVYGGDRIIFSWSSRPLEKGLIYELRVWKPTDAGFTVAASGVQLSAGILFRDLDAVVRGGDAEYYWTVAIVASPSGPELAVQATPRRIVYRRTAESAPQPTAAPPTQTPKPPDTAVPPTTEPPTAEPPPPTGEPPPP